MNKILAGLSVICKDKKEREKAASKDKYKKYKEEKDKRELEALRRNKQKSRDYHKMISKNDRGGKK